MDDGSAQHSSCFACPHTATDGGTRGPGHLLGRSLSRGDEPFQLCTWNGSSDELTLIDVKFHRSMKPEGVTTFSSGGKRKILLVDDTGGYAVVKARDR